MVRGDSTPERGLRPLARSALRVLGKRRVRHPGDEAPLVRWIRVAKGDREGLAAAAAAEDPEVKMRGGAGIAVAAEEADLVSSSHDVAHLDQNAVRHEVTVEGQGRVVVQDEHSLNGIFRKLRDVGYTVFPVNPNAETVEGVTCYPNVQAIPDGVEGVVIVTRPEVTEQVVRDFEEWVQQGAPDPRTDTEGATVSNSELTQTDVEAGRQFWAFQPIRYYRTPVVEDASWPDTEVDTFVLAKLEE